MSLCPYLIDVESHGSHFPHVFFATDAEDAVCGAADYLRDCWRGASIASATRLDGHRYRRLLGAGGADARRRVEAILDNPAAVAVVEAGASAAGGVDRALAALAGASKGLVAKVLGARGLRVVRGKLVADDAAAVA